MILQWLLRVYTVRAQSSVFLLQMTMHCRQFFRAGLAGHRQMKNPDRESPSGMVCCDIFPIRALLSLTKAVLLDNGIQHAVFDALVREEIDVFPCLISLPARH